MPWTTTESVSVTGTNSTAAEPASCSDSAAGYAHDAGVAIVHGAAVLVLDGAVF